VFKQVSWLPGLPTFCAFPESRLISLNRLNGFPVAYCRFRHRLQLRGSSRLYGIPWIFELQSFITSGRRFSQITTDNNF